MSTLDWFMSGIVGLVCALVAPFIMRLWFVARIAPAETRDASRAARVAFGAWAVFALSVAIVKGLASML